MCLGTSAAYATDPVRSSEWPLDSHHFQADSVWKVSRGAGVTVAVIDSGVSATHPDLAGQILPGASLLGDGGDGRTDASGDSHGTAIAGIIAGTGGPPPAGGMYGLAPAVKIMPVRVAVGSQIAPETLAQGIVWAADHGAQVINLSMGTASPDPLLQKAVNYALGKDIVLVAAAGNGGQSGNAPMYPAAYPGVVSVSGTDESGAFWAPSESGHGITLAAPATDIYSTNDQSQYVHADGTSYATAYVSAAAALVRSHEPHLSAGQVVRRLISTTSQHHARPDAKIGFGELDPLAALSATGDPGSPENPLLHPDAAPASAAGNSNVIVIGGAALGALLCAAGGITLRRRRIRSIAPASARQRENTGARGKSTAPSKADTKTKSRSGSRSR
ncbi:type VII secretion-associated serine protease mycosin [Kitasatospora sp. NBC_01250]|uniref:type VII secretion-associated serine protease mycosin n=1 Tax=Kitasatospora sp. NBC_01250 TaxID=2903571 RepID=UPI002E316560|nr:type VII secretion-associated serine protease mycosin [Kitasatospora sp. NBC_01250]